MNRTKLITISGMILAAAIIRLLPHPPNFTPIFAMALFGGTYINNKKMALLVPLATMLVSDLFIGLHILIPAVYGSIAIITSIGFLLKNRVRPTTMIGASLFGSLIFYLISNFAVWSLLGTYPQTPAGLVSCYIAALPYFKNTLISGLFYSALLFGAFEFAKRKFPVLEGNKPELRTL